MQRRPFKRTPTVREQIAELNRRIDAALPVSRFILKVQLEQLAKAEQLRKLALALIASRWQHRCPDKVGGIVAVSESKLSDLRAFVKGLASFHRKRPLPKSVIRILK